MTQLDDIAEKRLRVHPTLNPTNEALAILADEVRYLVKTYCVCPVSKQDGSHGETRKGESKMPYIKDHPRRSDLNYAYASPENVGELTYVLYKTCIDYLGEVPRYQQYAEVLGAIQGTQQEFSRMKLAPYEDLMKSVNGDV